MGWSLSAKLARRVQARSDGDPIPLGRNEAWGVFVFPYTLDLTATFEPSMGT